MSIPSFYGTGPDEEEIFRLTDPSSHPETFDESAAIQEAERLASPDYDDSQDEFDECQSGLEDVIQTLPRLSPAELEDVLQLIARLRGTG